MTIKEIKSEIKSFIFFAEVEARTAKKNEWGHGFQVGKINAYENCLRWLDQLEPSWHPYPKEKPTEDGYYQVTFDDSTVDLARWKDGSWTFNPKIIAWKEKDKPYKKEANNDH